MSKKCDSYCTRKRTKYLDPTTVAYITGKYPDNNGAVEYEVGYCSGTKNQENCSCDGDRTRCDFYPEVREKAKQKEFATRDWIQVSFNNDGTYNESYINAPIIDRRGKEPSVIGFIKAVDSEKVTGIVWSKNIHKELSSDGKVFFFEIPLAES